MPSDKLSKTNTTSFVPLSVRLRPQSLSEFIGQTHLLSKGKLLRRAIEADRISSLILFGPPGTGKTSLAYCIARATQAEFVSLNATNSNVDEVRKIIAAAKERKNAHAKRTILFIDEIHRFNKAQQDCLLPDVEEGVIVLIGATVHNPFFAIGRALVSRSLVCELKSLQEPEIKAVLLRALNDADRGLKGLALKVDDEALEFLSRACEGDARRALNALEIAALTTEIDQSGFRVINRDIAAESIQKKPVVYDRDEDGHYDTISAFIKSMRGSDPDAAIYWMAKMLYAGEDPRFIARRICILAAEDVGNADPLALVLANAAFNISEFVGMPEARIILAQAVTYVACAPKSNAAYMAIDQALDDVKNQASQEVPDHLKSAQFQGAKELNRGQGYKYAHDYPGHYVQQEYTKKKKQYYTPTDSGYEARIKKRMNDLGKPKM